MAVAIRKPCVRQFAYTCVSEGRWLDRGAGRHTCEETPMTRDDQIRQALEAAFSPRTLEVINESDRHAHHAGHDGVGESHYRVKIAAEAFGPMSRIERHRAVHDALGKELTTAIHALALEISG